jgi:L-threonylcarbamoyladenylate synthase
VTLEAQVGRAVEVLRQGGLVALPTETVYGLAADAENELAVRRIFGAKGRPSTHPLIVHLAGVGALEAWAREVPKAAHTLAEAFWPGPLTLVLRRSPRALDVITGGQDTVALRVPRHPLALEVLRAFGGGVAAPSANRFGKVSPTTAQHVRDELGDSVDLVLDGGPCEVGVESTIVDLSGPTPALLRPGGIAAESVEAVLGRALATPTAAAPRVSGSLVSHYAPRAGLVLVAPEELASRCAQLEREGRKVAAMAPSTVRLGPKVRRWDVPNDAATLARELYAALRTLDDEGHDVIVASLPDPVGLGSAIRDRLQRAAHPRS